MDQKRTEMLPPAFLERMKHMLKDEFPPFLESFDRPRTFGLRVNTGKISCEEFEALAPFPVRKIPWIRNGYFYEEESRPARCPLYQAGLYYLQDPGAMTPAARLPVEPGEYVLDLCAAPGGKATALGDALRGQGLLAANDISASRAKALLRNLELTGVPNIFVSSESPEKLAERFPGFFHKIVLDAPCSGEGMFRKEEALAKDWSPEKSRELARIQRRLLRNAADMLRPGGLLLYSTCTFAPEEDEGAVSDLLENRPEMTLLDMEGYAGFFPGVPSWGNGDPRLKKCVRIFPHRMEGEGHFLALFHRSEDPGMPVLPAPSNADIKLPAASSSKSARPAKPEKNVRQWIEEFFREIGLRSLGGLPFDWNRVEIRGDRAYYLPPVSQDFRGIAFLRHGLYLGDLKKNRFEPAQPLALALHKGDFTASISLSAEDEHLTRYLKGETLSIAPEEAANARGWHLLCVQGFPLGFGKLVNGTLKNKYPAGWRI